MEISVTLGDITKIKADAIVNAANTSLLGGGGVDGAIHRAGGKAILDDCVKIRNKQGGCAVGEAVITGAGELPAQYVIHAVGPVWKNGRSQEPELLQRAYSRCLDLAATHGIQVIAFPCISTGIYRFPKKEAAIIAINTVKQTAYKPARVIFVCFDQESYAIYQTLLGVQ